MSNLVTYNISYTENCFFFSRLMQINPLVQFNTHTILQPFFWNHLGEPVPEEIFFWTLWCKEDNRGRHSDYPAGHHSIRTNRRPTPPPSFPHFYAGCPSCHNPRNLFWLGMGTKYAGLHTQWLGLVQFNSQNKCVSDCYACLVPSLPY